MNKVSFDDIKQAMAGRELMFLRSAGLTEKQLSGKHQACEGCGGTDRYRTNKNAGDGSFFCGQGGETIGGNWVDHLCHVKNMSVSDVYHLAVDFLGLKEMEPWDKESSKKYQSELAEKAKLKDDNAYFDFHIKTDLDELVYLMQSRETPAIDDQERRQAAKVIAMLNKRYITKTATRPAKVEIPDAVTDVLKAGLHSAASEKRSENMEVAA